jgi:hypothetical protein
MMPDGCRGLPRRFGCEGATCHRAIGAVNGSLRLSRGPPLELCIDAQLPACRDHGRPRSGPFTVNESNRVADHERVCCRQVNHSLQTAGMDALFDASLFSAIDVHLIRER